MQTKTTVHAAFGKLIGQRGVIASLAALFLISFLIGYMDQRWHPVPEDGATTQVQNKNSQIERVFGPYRDAVRAGQVSAIAICAGMVFGINSLSCVFTGIGSIFILPALTSVWGAAIGRSVASLHGTTPFSVPAFVAMASLEWITYVLSASAGANIGLAFLFPKLKSGYATRREAVGRALRQTSRTYVAIGIIVVVQAIAEIFYVRAELLHGLTGVPSQPY